MRLSARLLTNVGNVNTYLTVPSLRMTQGNSQDVYLQLIDIDQDRMEQGFVPPGRRFVPVASSVLQVTLDSIDVNKKITRIASQPFNGDASIWLFNLLETDVLLGTIDFQLLLSNTVNNTYLKGRLQAALLVDPQRT